MCKKLEQKDFKVRLCQEQKGFAPLGGNDDTFMRIIAQKER